MISRADINDRVREWGLREDVVEKDYVLGWVLWGIASHSTLGQYWVFKGGTCLKKCYLETYRFSEDLDFTVLPGGPMNEADVVPLLMAMLERVNQESGIDFAAMPPRLKARPNGSAEGRIYYRGPRGSVTPASIKLDLSATEVVVRPPVLRNIAHAHADQLPEPNQVRCYSFDELFAEKLRAMGERSRPRDLYDIVNLFRRPDLRSHPKQIRDALREKCETKGVPIPTFDAISSSPFRSELESEWSNMLAHQLAALPPFDHFWSELPSLFAWLEGQELAPALAAFPMGADEETQWRPPATVATWGFGVPLETVRFAASNLLCVELGYQGSTRVIEPYSLRRTKDGNIILHAMRVDNREHRSYRVDRIQSVRATTRPFRPVYAVEFSSTGNIYVAPSLASPVSETWPTKARTRSSRSKRSGIVHIIQCPVCNKKFTRSRRDFALRKHKAPGGYPCHGRRGIFVETRYR